MVVIAAVNCLFQVLWKHEICSVLEFCCLCCAVVFLFVSTLSYSSSSPFHHLFIHSFSFSYAEQRRKSRQYSVPTRRICDRDRYSRIMYRYFSQKSTRPEVSWHGCRVVTWESCKYHHQQQQEPEPEYSRSACAWPSRHVESARCDNDAHRRWYWQWRSGRSGERTEGVYR